MLVAVSGLAPLCFSSDCVFLLTLETFGCEETKPSYLGLVIRKGKSLTLLLVPHALLDEVDKGLEKKPWIEG